MKFRILSFALLSAFALTFSFCAKEPVASTESSQTDQSTVDRGGPCEIRFTSTGPASICGTTNGAGICTSCNGANTYAGQANFGPGNDHIFGSTVTAGLGAVRNLTDNPIVVTALVNGVAVAQTQIAGFGCQDFRMVAPHDALPCGSIVFF